MKALLCTQHGDPELLEVRELPSPEPGPGQIRVDVHAAGVNFPDSLIIRNLYQFKPELPFSPEEFALLKNVKSIDLNKVFS
ncbi:MAG: NADPH:quinone oxidoreductase family protein, partial [Betaproteobacteria bacterium]|nr:NADPH:quinone oxidoreductase family protein [Betaproteobacteria bacterium]